MNKLFNKNDVIKYCTIENDAAITFHNRHLLISHSLLSHDPQYLVCHGQRACGKGEGGSGNSAVNKLENSMKMK